MTSDIEQRGEEREAREREEEAQKQREKAMREETTHWSEEGVAEKCASTDKSRFRFICCFMSRSTARVILRRVVYRWRKPVHTAL